MTFYPHTETDRQKMIRAIGVTGIEALFADVPESRRFPTLNLPPGLSPMEIERDMKALAAVNLHPGNGLVSFLGAGAYRHYTLHSSTISSAGASFSLRTRLINRK